MLNVKLSIECFCYLLHELLYRTSSEKIFLGILAEDGLHVDEQGRHHFHLPFGSGGKPIYKVNTDNNRRSMVHTQIRHARNQESLVGPQEQFHPQDGTLQSCPINLPHQPQEHPV